MAIWYIVDVNTSSKSTTLLKKHYTNNVFLTPEIAIVALAAVNILYSDFMTSQKNTCAEDQYQKQICANKKQATSPNIPLATIKHDTFQNVVKTVAKHTAVAYWTFATCASVALVQVLIISRFLQNHQINDANKCIPNTLRHPMDHTPWPLMCCPCGVGGVRYRTSESNAMRKFENASSQFKVGRQDCGNLAENKSGTVFGQTTIKKTVCTTIQTTIETSNSTQLR